MDKPAETGIQEPGVNVPPPLAGDPQTGIKEPGVEVPPLGEAAPPEPQARPPKHPVIQVLSVLASLRLTVVLLALGIFLVLAGTLAQKELSNWTAVNKYFRWWYVWIPAGIFIPRLPNGDLQLEGWGFPFPGGWTIGAALLVNLLAAHAVRFKLSWKRSGILILHAGIIVMLLGELATGLFAIEGRMTIEEGKSANFVEDYHRSELVILEPTGPKTETVVAVPDSLLKKNRLIQNELLPFDVEVVKFFVNSKLGPLAKDNPATFGAGLQSGVVELGEVSGIAQDQGVEVPSAYVTFKRKDNGQSLGTYLVSIYLNEQPLTVDGKTYQVLLRFKRTYFPFSLNLIEFRNDKYLGTDKPKNYSSLVRLNDPNTGENREVLIKMNHPLFYDWRTFYQADFLQKQPGDPKGTILQVVLNPSWIMPYVSCVLVALGMMIHFGINLFGFLEAKAKTSAPVARNALPALTR